MKNAKTLLLLSILSFSAISADRPTTPQTDFGFADIGYEGFEYRPNLITWKEANNFCSLAAEQLSGENVYQRCVNSFIPTLEAEPPLGNDCAGSPVKWSICHAVINSGKNGETSEVNHLRGTTNNYIGKAKFSCLNGTWIYKEGNCVDLPDNCDADTEITWSVDYPVWAKTGGLKPQPACRGTLDSEKRSATISTITADGSDHNTDLSKAQRACMDNTLIALPDRPDTCLYTPKTCNAETVNYGNCNFNLPTTIHPYSTTAPAVPVSVAFDGSTYHGNYSTSCFDGTFLAATTNTCFQNSVCNNSTTNSCSVGSVSNQQNLTTSVRSCPDGYTLNTGDNKCYRYTNSTTSCYSTIIVNSYEYYDPIKNGDATCTYQKKRVISAVNGVCSWKSTATTIHGTGLTVENDGCSSGTIANIQSPSFGVKTWRCEGSNGGSTDTDCTVYISPR